MPNILVWDIETIPDISGFAAANNLFDKTAAKSTLHELCRVMGLTGKPDGIDGGEVEKYFREGRLQDIADYCESDVVNTYRVWLRHELFRGKLTDAAFEASEANLSDFITARSNAKPHLAELT